MTLVGCAAGSATPETKSAETVLRSPGGGGSVKSITWNMGSGEPATLDPPNVPTYSAMAVVSNLCDSLMSVDETGTVVPGLANVTQETPTRLVFTLRGQATFWDGTPLTTDDVVYSLQHAAAPTSFLAPTFAKVTNIAAISGTQVALDFSAPDAAFLPTMAGPGGAVIERAFGEKAGAAIGTPSGGLMCSGPFKLDKWNAGTDIRLVKNEAYWDKERQAHVSSVRLTFVTDTSALTQALTTGEIDGGWEIPATAIPALKSATTGSIFYGETTSVWSLRVANPSSPLAKNADLRQALQHLIDRTAISEAVFHGAARPWSTAISPNSWPVAARDATNTDYKKIAGQRTYDLELARKLVDKSGAKGTTLELIVASGDDTASQLAQLVQAQMAKVGLTVKLRALQPIQYAQAMYDPAVRGSSDLMLSVGGDVVQEPLTSIRYYFLPDGLYNWDGFNDPEVATLYGQAITELDLSKRTSLTLQIQALFEARAATVAIVNPYQVNFVNKRLGGVITSSVVATMPSLTYIGAGK